MTRSGRFRPPSIGRSPSTVSPILKRLHPLERALTAFAAEFSPEASRSTDDSPLVDPVVVWRPRLKHPQRGRKGPSCINGFTRLSGKAAREAVADAMGRIRYVQGETVNRARRLCGFVGVPPHLVQKAKRLNLAKDALREVLAPLRGRQARVRVRTPNTSDYALEVRELTTIALARLGLSDVNLLAAYRHIPYVDEPLDSLHFMVTRARSAPRVTVESARKLLDRTGGPDLAEDHARLDRLDDGETLCAPKKPSYDRLRYRAVYRARSDVGNKASTEGPGELPLLVPIPNDGVSPDWKDPTLPKSSYATVRSQTEDEPYLKSIKLYRLTSYERERRRKRDAAEQ